MNFSTLIILFPKSAKEIIVKYGVKTKNNTYIFEGREYTFTETGYSSKPHH